MKTIINNIRRNYKTIAGTLIVGIVLGWLIFGGTGNAPHPTSEKELVEHKHSEEQTTWTCSMHPQIKQDEPGDCPICGMDLIPLSTTKNDGDNISPDEIMMSESAAKLAEIQTSKVERGAPENTLFLQGKVMADERNIAALTARFGGRIEKLFVNFTGQQVQKGEKLATIYSPELITAQRELLEAIKFKESRPQLYRAARAKLKLWDLSNEQIDAIEQQGDPKNYFDVLSPISGTVMNRHVAQGDYIKVGNPLFKVVKLSNVWVLFDAYETDLPWIEIGDTVDINIKATPGKTYKATVSFIDPFIDPQTRTAKVRVELKNSQRELKPEMFATGKLRSNIAGSAEKLLIPKTAVLWTGKRSVVYVKVPERENPSFIYREIGLGPVAGKHYVVTDGLEEGEEIATNGVFKIDAAAQLEGKKSMMSPEGGTIPAGHNHGEMDMNTGDQDGTLETVKADPKFVKQLTAFYEAYIKMNEAFIKSDAAEVSKTAKNATAALENIKMELLQDDAHIAWMEQLNILKPALENIAKSNDLEKQRLEYATFNLAFYKSLKMFGLDNDTTYYQYCPMANGDQGAYWFSAIKEIRNPYFGDMMLSCGETRETLK
ncbi:MAG: efflux RND transporter periplasmic adaptor subunit [Prolixibacteraceae bacterium]|jgi:Cu(I)/Ag(I) efflux system membrane fusion protein|nr:efflux RND transporter periplasmic adaptor subunit [Prolixibacteraceae bacterium]